jgi:small subunit ribosomal protein S9
VSDAEHPSDEQRPDDQEAAAEEVPTEGAEEPAGQAETPEPASEEPQAQPEPVAEEPQARPAPAEAPEPVAEEPQAQPEPAAAEQPAAEEAPQPAAEAPQPPAAAPQAPQPAAEAPQAPQPAAEAPQAAGEEHEEDEEEEIAPRQRPEIPGADLIPDLVSDSDEFLDAESRAAAEAEAEAAAARAAEDDSQQEAQPIADAAIDLAAGARYTATGKRKTAVARVILKPGTGTYAINGKELNVFFPRETLQRIIRQPLEAVGYESRMDVVARMHGGGVAAQAGALRHGISRALLEADPNLRGELKRRGFLTRDPRVKERKKAGLKKARKRPQFSKR